MRPPAYSPTSPAYSPTSPAYSPASPNDDDDEFDEIFDEGYHESSNTAEVPLSLAPTRPTPSKVTDLTKHPVLLDEQFDKFDHSNAVRPTIIIKAATKRHFSRLLPRRRHCTVLSKIKNALQRLTYWMRCLDLED